jgi:RNase P protein component
VRRRLRAILAETIADEVLPARTYLVIVHPTAAATSFSDLRAEVRRLVERVVDAQ